MKAINRCSQRTLLSILLCILLVHTTVCDGEVNIQDTGDNGEAAQKEEDDEPLENPSPAMPPSM